MEAKEQPFDPRTDIADMKFALETILILADFFPRSFDHETSMLRAKLQEFAEEDLKMFEEQGIFPYGGIRQTTRNDLHLSKKA